MSENECNVRDSKNRRYNYIYNYISKIKRGRLVKEYLLRLDPEVYEEFRRVASSKFGLHYGANTLVEALMKMFIEDFKDSPIIQTTLFYKPTIIQQQQNVRISLKLQIKMIKQELEHVLSALEQKRGDSNFYMQKLRKIVERASKLYDSTYDSSLKTLLERAESWI